MLLNRYSNENKTNYCELSDDNASEVIAAGIENKYLNINNIQLSVFKAAVGGDGILELREDLTNTILFTWNVDSVKEPALFFENGLKLPQDAGAELVISGAVVSNASISAVIEYYYTNK